MKSLKSYLEQLFVTPLNTTGFGNMEAPSTIDNSIAGSGDVITPVCIGGKAHKLKRKKKKYESNSK